MTDEKSCANCEYSETRVLLACWRKEAKNILPCDNWKSRGHEEKVTDGEKR